jgi:hypothetical protein
MKNYFLLGFIIILTFISCEKNPTLAIGDPYEGGVIVHLEGNGSGIIAAESSINTTSINWESAKQACSSLILNGYGDWRLPTKDELNHIFQSRNDVPNLGSEGYWSSTEKDADSAWLQYINTSTGNGEQTVDLKVRTHFARPVRSF